jgi:hypothetical protein
VSSKPPVTASVPATWTAEPTQPFTTLKDAIAKANPNIVYAHVAFPRQHTPLPIECTVDAHRFEADIPYLDTFRDDFDFGNLAGWDMGPFVTFPEGEAERPDIFEPM